VALRLGIAHERGSLQKGSFADLAFFTEGLELTDLMAGGSWLLQDGIVAKLDPLE
jgi:N-acetylglucosamine-6-phosphate deacetylase